tara:strand:+ start:312 stop:605 length:294 start_codon:yes stop_codon:yes gene_type:complete
MSRYISDYEKYLLLSDHKDRTVSGDYTGYINTKQVIEIIQTMSQNRKTTYLYNGDLKNSDLSLSDINTIMECWEDGKYRSGFKNIRKVAGQMGIRKI